MGKTSRIYLYILFVTLLASCGDALSDRAAKQSSNVANNLGIGNLDDDFQTEVIEDNPTFVNKNNQGSNEVIVQDFQSTTSGAQTNGTGLVNKTTGATDNETNDGNNNTDSNTTAISEQVCDPVRNINGPDQININPKGLLVEVGTSRKWYLIGAYKKELKKISGSSEYKELNEKENTSWSRRFDVFDSTTNPVKGPLGSITLSRPSTNLINIKEELNFNKKNSGKVELAVDHNQPGARRFRVNFTGANVESFSDLGNCGGNIICLDGPNGKGGMNSKETIGSLLNQDLKATGGVIFKFFRGKRGPRELSIIKRWNHQNWNATNDHHFRRIYHFWETNDGMNKLCNSTR